METRGQLAANICIDCAVPMLEGEQAEDPVAHHHRRALGEEHPHQGQVVARQHQAPVEEHRCLAQVVLSPPHPQGPVRRGLEEELQAQWQGWVPQRGR